MPRLRAKYLHHRVDLIPMAKETGSGEDWSQPTTDRPAHVEQKVQLVRDQRADSATFGQEITSTAFVILLPEDDVLPRTRVRIWKGTPREVTSEVVASARLDYNDRTPNHVELYLE